MNTRVGGAEEMAAFAADFLLNTMPAHDAATVVALSGELGAGKTTFAQSVARTLGVEEAVNSPTFVIEKIYALSQQKWRKLIHIDAYRLHGADELRSLGWDEMLEESGNLILIEWPENVPGAIPESARRISIHIDEGEKRTITYGD